RKNIYKDFNLGISFVNDKSGSSKLTLNQLNIALSTNFNILKVNSFSLGLLAGFGQKSIDYSDLIFEENENFITNNFLFPDLGFGINYQTNPHQILSYNFGISSYHINSPNNSFNEDDLSKLPMKNNFNFGINYRFSEKTRIISEIIYTNQSIQKEILVGLRPIVKLDETYLFPLIYYRINDAAIIGFGMEKNNIQANISYDINTSDLTTASNYRSGFEFSVIYIWKNKKKEKKIEETEEKCPKYL
ncbi:MAG TPA: PorP/SprF family type IX secretion system membrane protein, partial [Flavobacteriales bacterium]|nr:PorP/SprF family type IX secretion system membrane protein [Flavobacteriales bacterium]